MIPHLARLAFFASVPFAAALWAKGYVANGDGFAAGILAGLGAVAASVAGRDEEGDPAWVAVPGARIAHGAMVLGLVVVLFTAFLPTLFGHPPVAHFPAPGAHVTKLGTLELHTALIFDAGIALLVFGAVVRAFEHLRHAVHETDPKEAP